MRGFVDYLVDILRVVLIIAAIAGAIFLIDHYYLQPRERYCATHACVGGDGS